jgi:DNA-binding MarR family transcriptional regulator
VGYNLGVSETLTNEWRDLLSRHARTVCALDEALGAHGLGMSEFEVLERLACECGERPRMQELAAAVHLSQSALSRTVGRLEKDGLVHRAMCPEDRRGVAVCLTAEGRERYEAARPTHRQVLAETLTPPQQPPA